MDFNTVDIENIQYNRPSVTSGRKYIAEAKYEVEGNFPEDIEIISPHLLAKSPIKSTDRKCYLSLRLSRANRDFFKFLTGLEEHSKASILENTHQWFQKSLPIDVIDDYHNQFIKISSNEDPSIRVQIPYDKETGDVQIPIVTDKGANVKQSTIFEGTIVRVQMRYVGIKFYKQQFASEWYATKLVVYDNYEQDDDEDEFDFRDNEDMLSIYSEQPQPEPESVPDVAEMKINKVIDDNLETIETELTPVASAGTTTNDLVDTKADELKVVMVSESIPEVSESTPEVSEIVPEHEPETENVEKTEKKQKKSRTKLVRPKRRRVKLPNGKIKVLN